MVILRDWNIDYYYSITITSYFWNYFVELYLLELGLINTEYMNIKKGDIVIFNKSIEAEVVFIYEDKRYLNLKAKGMVHYYVPFKSIASEYRLWEIK